MDCGSTNDGVQKVEQVTSVGSSWIICRSKSHAGRIYYFNTLTGKAAWNLSEAEVEKARNRTKIFTNQEDAHIEDFPEPKESPVENNKSSQQCNMQIIDKKNLKQSFSMPRSAMVPSCHVFANPINTIIPVQLNLESHNAGYSTNVWAVPSTHQFYIASASPIVNQNQASVTLPCTNQSNVTAPSKNADIPDHIQNSHKKRFDSNPQKHFQRPFQFYRRDNNTIGQRGNNNQNICNKKLGSFDLRMLLKAKNRTFSQTQYEVDSEEQVINNSDYSLRDKATFKLEQNCSSQQINKEESKFGDVDSDWLEENIIVQGVKFKLDVSKLKKIAKPQTKTDHWYIVPDKYILLNHLHFLNILCNSDDECVLMVPQQLLTELEEDARVASTARIVNRARRAASFLKQQPEAGFIQIVKEVRDVKDNGNYLLNCCLHLSRQNFFVILLLSDNIELNTHQCTSEISIFTIKEIKQFLAKPSLENETSTIEASKCFLPQTVKIVIPNDLMLKQYVSQKVDKEAQVNVKDLPITTKTTELESPKNVTSQEETLPSNRKVKVAGVDTHSQHLSMTINNSRNTTSTESSKREIRLNRSLNKNTPLRTVDASVQKIRPKWRKTRPTTSKSNAPSVQMNNTEQSSTQGLDTKENSNDTPDTQTSITEKTVVIPNVSDQTCSHENEGLPVQLPNELNDNITLVDDNNDSEASSSIIQRTIVNDSFIIEETSTSGVISNTSNDDSKSESGHFCYNMYGEETRQSISYKTADFNIDEDLEVGNNEWVSRFIQIMDECLTEVLQEDQHFLENVVYKMHGAGPWSFMEVLKSVELKFNYRRNVTAAVGKLMNVICTVIDETGRILKNLRPHECMEMNSYGLLLVNALQSEIDCVDLLNAEQALLNLYNDIKTPDVDSGQTDNYDDSSQGSSSNLHKVSRPQINNKASTLSSPRGQQLSQHEDPEDSDACNKRSNYRLRSRVSNSLQSQNSQSQNNEENVQNVKKKKISFKNVFFSNLNLKQNCNVKATDSIPDLGSSPQNTTEASKISPVSQNIVNISNEHVHNYYGNDESDSQTKQEDEICLQIENSILDNRDDKCNHSTMRKPDESNSTCGNSKLEDINNNLNFIFKRVLTDIRKALVHVSTYCESTLEELKNDSNYSTEGKLQITRGAEIMQSFLSNICQTLNNIYYRETSESNNGIQCTLNKAGVNVSDSQRDAYRNSISEYLEQANLLQNSLALIKIVAEQKPIPT